MWEDLIPNGLIRNSNPGMAAYPGSGGPYLSHRDSADAGVQHTGVGVGTHLAHEGEPLLPSHRVLPNLLSMGEQWRVLF